MSTEVLASLVTAVVAVIGTLLATFAWKPGQKVTTDANVAQAQIDIATGALKLVTTGLTEEVKRISAELMTARQEVRDLTAEVIKCRAHIAQLEAQLAARD